MSTVRIKEETHERLRRLAEESGAQMTDVVDVALAEYERRSLLERMNSGYAALEKDASGWRELRAERAAWDETLADGLGDA